MPLSEPMCVQIRYQTVNDFYPWFTVWLVNPDDPEDLIDVIFEEESLDYCVRFCTLQGYEIASMPSNDWK